MKEPYIVAEMEVVEFSVEDVISTSTGYTLITAETDNEDTGLTQWP